MSSLPSPVKEGNTKTSAAQRKSLLEKYTIKPVGTYKSESTLPSLQVAHDRKAVSISSEAFTQSVPTLHRDRMNLLFEGSIEYDDDDSSNASTSQPYIPTGFSRAGLKTPPHIRKAIQDAIFLKALESGPSVESKPGSKVSSPAKDDERSDHTLDDKKGSNNGDAYISKRRGHSLYFYTVEEKEKLCPEYYLVEEHEEEINHLHDVQHAKNYMYTVATYNPRSTPPLHSDHSSLPTPPSSRAASRASSREDKLSSSTNSVSRQASARPGYGTNLTSNTMLSSRRNSKDPFDISNFSDRLYGPHAKEKFAEKFMQSMQKLRLYPSDDILPDDMKTPRTMYLRDLDGKNRLPLPLILRDHRRTDELKGIYLPNRGIGDEYLLSVISVLHLLPVIENIDLRSNRLTDLSLGPLANKLVTMPHLLYLNLSGNDVDDSSEQIREFIENPNCSLQTFILDNSDVDDIECAKLADALQKNKSITTLSLCHNKIGEMELLNVVMPDLITGGEALGAMLEKNTTLTELDLRWNSIRLNSADVLADSLAKNDTLRVLKVANNAFGESAVELMGRSLKRNACLEELDLSFNNLNPRSMSVLSNSLIHNDTLLKLNVDGCLLGAVGTQAFVAAIQRAAGLGRQLEISFKSAECDVHDPNVFNPANPTGTWELDLSTPYGQMVTEECFFLTNNKIGCDMLSLVYYPPHGPRTKIDIVHKSIIDEKKSKFEEKQFRKLSKNFNEYLKDQKLEEAIREMRPILEMFSFGITNTLLGKIVKQIEHNWNKEVDKGRYHVDDLGDVLMFQLFIALFQIADEDGSGFVSYDELDGIFKLLGIKYESKDDQQRIYKEFDFDGTGQVDIDEFSNAMVQEFCVYNPPKGPLIDKSTNAPWVIPEEGKVVIEMFYEVGKPGLFNVMRNDMMQATLEQLRGIHDHDQRLTVFKHVVNSPYYYMNAGQAQMLFDEMYHNTDGDLDLVVEMLPQIIDHHNVMRFLDNNLTSLGKFALRVKLGNMYNAYIGNPTGHYLFDLKNRLQRLAAKKLSTLAVSEANYCKREGIDTSQKGTYSVLRNETLSQGQGNPNVIKADSVFFSHTPYSGKLRFDYASTDRPRTGTRPVSSFKLHKLIETCNLEELVFIQDRYNDCENEEARKSLYKTMLKEYLPNVLSIVYLKRAYYEFMETSHSRYDTVMYPKERMRDMSRPNYHSGTKNLVTPRDMKVELDDHHDSKDYDPMFPFAYWKLLLLQTYIGGYYFSCEQVIKILSYFPIHDYMRVQVLLTFFGKLTDLDMLFMIVDFQFSLDEKFETYHRLGILNCIDPIRIEKYFMLDLRRWDHREVAKILVKLAQLEPGDNWLDPKYRWSKYDEEVPGWTLPSTWIKPDAIDPLTGEHMGGPRYDGWLTLTYTSTGKGCSAIYSVRRRLRDTCTLTGLQKLL